MKKITSDLKTRLPKLLIVDDAEDMIEYLSDALSDDYETLTATNGEEALALLHSEVVQLVVSDVVMPRIDGFELCKMIKKDRDICHVPVVLLTAKNSMQSRIEGLETGADAYIEKPVLPVFLKAQIDNLLKSRKQLRTFFAQKPFTTTATIVHTNTDNVFLEKLSEFILAHSEEEAELEIDMLADEMNMSRITFYRKVRALTAMTPRDFINVTRLKKAAELLTDANNKVYEVAYQCGFKSPTYFGKRFYKQFGVTPAQFQKKQFS